MKIVTHNDRFHADDVCAMATLKILFGDKITEVIRTRDESVIQNADIVFDVGNIYNPDTNRFDHHQTAGAGKRENGIPYASFGLVWKKIGKELCGSQEVADALDKKIVQVIDAGDNGFSLCSYLLPDIKEYGIHNICNSFGSTWKEQDEYDTAFFEVVKMIEQIIRREIKVAQDKFEALPHIQKAYQDTQDKRIVILDEYYPWQDVLPQYADVLFVISPSKDKTQWRVNTIQENFVSKKDFPKEWAGLRTQELQNISGVQDALFCHRNLFLAVAQSKEGSIALAKIALES